MATTTTKDYKQQVNVVDLSPYFPLIAAQNNPLLTLLTARKGPQKIKSLYMYKTVGNGEDTDYSGKKAEGADATEFKASQRTRVKNICEIFSENVKVSDTITDGLGINGQQYLLDEAKIKLAKIKKDFEFAMLNSGAAVEEDPRQLAGLSTFAGKTIDLGKKALTVEALEEASIEFYNKGFMDNDVYLIINAKDATKLKKAYLKAGEEEKTTVTINTGAQNIGIRVNKIVNSFGDINLVYTPNLKEGTAYLVNLKAFDLGYLRAPQVKKLGKDGDNTAFSAVMEATYIANPAGVIQFKNLGATMPSKTTETTGA